MQTEAQTGGDDSGSWHGCNKGPLSVIPKQYSACWRLTRASWHTRTPTPQAAFTCQNQTAEEHVQHDALLNTRQRKAQAALSSLAPPGHPAHTIWTGVNKTPAEHDSVSQCAAVSPFHKRIVDLGCGTTKPRWTYTRPGAWRPTTRYCHLCCRCPAQAGWAISTRTGCTGATFNRGVSRADLVRLVEYVYDPAACMPSDHLGVDVDTRDCKLSKAVVCTSTRALKTCASSSASTRTTSGVQTCARSTQSGHDGAVHAVVAPLPGQPVCVGNRQPRVRQHGPDCAEQGCVQQRAARRQHD